MPDFKAHREARTQVKESDARYIYAAFQGGGAKAVAYAGAVKAVYEQGYRFRGLSGTSAGAISATLLAADYSPDEIASKIPELLKCVRRTPWIVLHLGARSARDRHLLLGETTYRTGADAPGQGSRNSRWRGRYLCRAF
ncbi:MAG: patatin-like phospholipase family protein [Kineosporiaceae bacterium]|nr:patatin-like phospholipase family protein [Kineosporiaceae bacterium]